MVGPAQCGHIFWNGLLSYLDNVLALAPHAVHTSFCKQYYNPSKNSEIDETN